jgi:hypothetical protein
MLLCQKSKPTPTLKHLFLSSIIFLFIIPAFAQDNERERLKEEIRKEIEAEQRDKDLREQLRNEILKEEAIKKAENEKRLIEEANSKAQERKKKLSEKAKKEVVDFNSKRSLGWSISATIGPNFAVGNYGNQTSRNGGYAGVGVYVDVNNYWHFGRIMGISLGFTYDDNKFAASSFFNNIIKQAAGNNPDLSFGQESTAYKNYTIKVGPNIRVLGKKASFMFNPFVSLTIHEPSDFFISVYLDGAWQANIKTQRNQSLGVGTGATASAQIHMGKRSELIFGMSFMYVKVQSAFVVRATGVSDEQGYEDIEPIRLAPYVGYRFNL